MPLVEQCVAVFPGILHIIAIAESWLTPLNHSTFRLKDYCETHQVRSDSGGGGISIFIHKSVCGIDPKILIDAITPNLNHFLIMDIPSSNITIAIPYRRPGLNLNSDLNCFLQELEQ